MSSEQTMDGLEDLCEHFQLDLSCLVDGELDERAAGAGGRDGALVREG